MLDLLLILKFANFFNVAYSQELLAWVTRRTVQASPRPKCAMILRNSTAVRTHPTLVIAGAQPTAAVPSSQPWTSVRSSTHPIWESTSAAVHNHQYHPKPARLPLTRKLKYAVAVARTPKTRPVGSAAPRVARMTRARLKAWAPGLPRNPCVAA